jgi:hypothetical protein
MFVNEMKRITAVILSLSLILCSCGKSNKPLVKRDPSEYVEKTIPVIRYDQDAKELGVLNVKIKDNNVVNINSLKNKISEKDCRILSGFYCKGDICEKLTEENVNIDKIDRFDLFCEARKDNTTPTPRPPPSASPQPKAILEPQLTPAPSSTEKTIPSTSKSPQPTETLEPQLTSEPSKTHKYAYFKTLGFVILTVIIVVIISKVINKCRGNYRANAPVAYRENVMGIVHGTVLLDVVEATRVINPENLEVTLEELNNALKSTDLNAMVDHITNIFKSHLCHLIPSDTAETVYNYLKERLHELAELEKWKTKESEIFMTIMRAVNRLGLHNRLMAEQQQFYKDHQIPERYFILDNLTDNFKDVTQIITYETCQALINRGNLSEIIGFITDLHEKNLIYYIIPLDRSKISDYLKERLHELARRKPWNSNKVAIFKTITRAIKRLRMPKDLTTISKTFRKDRRVYPDLFNEQNLTDDFADVTEIAS